MKTDFKTLCQALYSNMLLFGRGSSIPYQLQELRSSTDQLDTVALIFGKATDDVINKFTLPNFWDMVGKPIDDKHLRNSHIFHAVKRAPVVTDKYDPISTYVLVKDLIKLGWFPTHYGYGSTPSRTLEKGKDKVLLKGFNNHWVRLSYYGIVMRPTLLSMFREFTEHGLVPNMLISNSHLGNSKCKLQIVLQQVNVFGRLPIKDDYIANEIVIPDSVLGAALTHRWMNDEKVQYAVNSIHEKLEGLLTMIGKLKKRKVSEDEKKQIELALFEYVFGDRDDVEVTFIDRRQVPFSPDFTCALDLMWNIYNAVVNVGVSYVLLPDENRSDRKHMTYKIANRSIQSTAVGHHRFTQQLFGIFYDLLEST